MSCEDEARRGRPISIVDETNVTIIRSLVDENPHFTVDEISFKVGISGERVFHILKAILGMRKLCSRWVPHFITNDQKRQRVDICRSNQARFQSRRGREEFQRIVT